MRVAVLAAAAVVSLAAAVTAEADYRILNDAALREAVVDKTVRLETPVGSIPINFKSDGTMVGRSQDMVSYLGRSYDQGTWWIASNQLCQKWKMWLDGKSHCFTIRQDGQKVHWTRGDGLQGVMTVSK